MHGCDPSLFNLPPSLPALVFKLRTVTNFSSNIFHTSIDKNIQFFSFEAGDVATPLTESLAIALLLLYRISRGHTSDLIQLDDV